MRQRHMFDGVRGSDTDPGTTSPCSVTLPGDVEDGDWGIVHTNWIFNSVSVTTAGWVGIGGQFYMKELTAAEAGTTVEAESNFAFTWCGPLHLIVLIPNADPEHYDEVGLGWGVEQFFADDLGGSRVGTTFSFANLPTELDTEDKQLGMDPFDNSRYKAEYFFLPNNAPDTFIRSPGTPAVGDAVGYVGGTLTYDAGEENMTTASGGPVGGVVFPWTGSVNSKFHRRAGFAVSFQEEDGDFVLLPPDYVANARDYSPASGAAFPALGITAYRESYSYAEVNVLVHSLDHTRLTCAVDSDEYGILQPLGWTAHVDLTPGAYLGTSDIASWTITWGDGTETTDTGFPPPSLTHTYDAVPEDLDDTWNMTMTLVDDYGFERSFVVGGFYWDEVTAIPEAAPPMELDLPDRHVNVKALPHQVHQQLLD